MKKLTLLTLIVSLFSLTLFAQEPDETDTKDDFKRWQVRFRGLFVSPFESDNLPGAEVDVSATATPEVDFTYFFTKNIAAELILATTYHEVDLGSTSLGGVWLLPPTLTLQYHFPMEQWKPYVGAGVNYTIFYEESNGDIADMDYDDSFGFAFQLGVDYFLNDKWFLNLDVKQLILSTDVDAQVNLTTSVPVEVDLNPIIIGFGVGFRF
jgi:outer membrane protein